MFRREQACVPVQYLHGSCIDSAQGTSMCLPTVYCIRYGHRYVTRNKKSYTNPSNLYRLKNIFQVTLLHRRRRLTGLWLTTTDLIGLRFLPTNGGCSA